MKEVKPTVPLIYQRMERGEIPKWLGLTVVIITWAVLVIPVLILTFPVWGSVAAYNWLKKSAEKENRDTLPSTPMKATERFPDGGAAAS